MQTCYHCGDRISFFHDGFRAIPVHESGSCSRRAWGGGTGSEWDSFRTTSEGISFDFPFVTYESYVNPNARCPVCGAAVYFYQSPYGGRVFFDELGPPWPKHPCTDHPQVRQEPSTSAGRSRILTIHNGASADGVLHVEDKAQADQDSRPAEARRPPPWAKDGWMPFVVERVVPRGIGIEAIGQLYPGTGLSPMPLRIVQADFDAQFLRRRGGITFGYSLTQNANVILSILNEAPIFLRRNDNPQTFDLSSLILTKDHQVEVVTCHVERHSD